jgi:hypothetical protein
MTRRLTRNLIVRLLACSGALLIATTAMPTAWAEDAREREIRELKQRLERLEKEVGVRKDAPPPAAAPAEAPQSVGDRLKSLEETIKATPLFNFVKDWEFGGHVAVSYNYNFRNPNSHSNNAADNEFYRVFDDRANQFTINQAELWVEKPTSDASPIGFGLDFVIGRDAKKIHSSGLGSEDDVFDLTQAYVTYKAPIGRGLDLKAGKFVTLHGAEVIRRTGNFHVSRSVQFGNAIPFTHTGILATYPFTDWLTVTGGIVNGWDNSDDENKDKSFTGMATVTPLENLTLSIRGAWGPETRFDGDTRTSPKRGLIDFIATYKPIPPLTLMVNYDYGRQDEAFEDGGKSATWHAVSGYASYDVTDRFAVGVRGEYFRDEDGFRLGLDPNTGKPFNVWEVTLTARYKLFEHLFASIEYRHDQATNSRKVFDDGDTRFSASSQDTIAVELVYQF